MRNVENIGHSSVMSGHFGRSIYSFIKEGFSFLNCKTSLLFIL